MRFLTQIRTSVLRYTGLSVFGILCVGLIASRLTSAEELPVLDQTEVNVQKEVWSISCKTGVKISISSEGVSEIIPAFFVPPNHPNFDDLILSINGRDDNFVYCEDVGLSFMVTIHDPIANETCMGSFQLEDKLPPVFDCGVHELPCGLDIYNIQPPYSELVTVSDNCTENPTVIILNEQHRFLDCTSPYTYELIRTYRATDEWGNSSTCTDTARFVRPVLDSIIFPNDTTMSCEVFNSDTSVTGQPMFMGYPLTGYCSTWFTKSDLLIPMGCPGRFKIMRTWTVMDECTGGMRTDVQNIMSIDTTDPVITCPASVTLEADEVNCNAVYQFPTNIATDNCTPAPQITYSYRVDGLVAGGNSTTLTLGEHTIEVTANDGCGNTATCSFTVTVIDVTGPHIVCNDLIVGLNNLGLGVICADTLSFDYFDNCSDEFDVTVRKMSDPDFTECVTYTCEEIGADNMLVVKVCDESGNCTECMVTVTVQDLEPPVFACPTAPVTISCIDLPGLDPSEYEPSVTDNCGPPEVTFDSTWNISCNNDGNITITYTATDASGNTANCTVNIIVVNDHPLTEEIIVWPGDIFMGGCDPNLMDTSITGYPYLTEEVCNTLWIGNRLLDTLQNGEGCGIILLEWVVIDECIFDQSGGAEGMFTHVQSITVEHLFPPVLTVPDGVTVVPEFADCSASVDLDSAFAMGCGQPITITNDFNGNGANLDGNYPYGTTIVVVTATNKCGISTTDTVIVNVLYPNDGLMICPEPFTVTCLEYNPDDLPEPAVLIVCEEYEIDVTVDDSDLDDCGVGDVEVTYIMTSTLGFTDTCTTTVTVVPDEGLTEDDIIWPDDLTMAGCTIDLTDSTMTGSPSVSGTYCGDILETSEVQDTIYDQDGCAVILLEWTVTDVCLFAQSGGTDGAFSYVQEITVTGAVPPMLIIPNDTILEPNTDDCGAFIDFPLVIAEGCGADITVTNNYNGNGANLDDTYPYGPNEVIVTAMNECGLIATDTLIVTVEFTGGIILTCPEDLEISCLEFDFNDIEEPTYNIDCGNVNVEQDIEGNLDDCGVGTLTVTYTLTSDIGTESCSFTIDVLPTEGVQPEDITWPAHLLDGVCGADLEDEDFTGVPVVTGEFCNLFAISSTPVDTLVNNEGCAEIQLQWTVLDQCLFDRTGGTQGMYTYIQRIVDLGVFPPSLTIPDDVTAEPSNDDCTASVDLPPATVSGCGIITVTNSFNDNGANLDGDYPYGTTVVIVTAENECGLSVSDTFTVIIEHEQIISCPADQTVSCVEFEEGNIPGPEFDLCGNVTVDTIITGELNECGEGILDIKFVVSNQFGISDSCSFNLTVSGGSSLEEGDIVWPESPLPVDCGDSYDPEDIFSEPAIVGQNLCGIYEITYDDSPADTANGDACFAITRAWTVIDVCNYDSITGEGIFTFDQHIDIEDDTPPVMIGYNNGDTILAPLTVDDCKRIVEIDVLFDDCSGIDTVINTAPDPTTSNYSGSGYYTLGVTAVDYFVSDSCGNESEFTLYINVVDSFPPTWDCPDTLIWILDPSGLDTIHASYFSRNLDNKAHDNCFLFDSIFFTFDSTDLSDSLLYLACSGDPGELSINDVTVWVFDLVGLSTSCTIDFIVQEPPGGADCTHMFTIAGEVESAKGEPIPGALMTAETDQTYSTFTDDDGKYVLQDISGATDAIVQGSKKTDPLQGVNTQDIIFIRDHMLDKKPLEDPYCMLAADVNQDNRITVRDIVEIRRLILGVQESYTSDESWKFADRAYQFADPLNPFYQEEVYKKKVGFSNGVVPKVDFRGVKLGDVNNTVTMNLDKDIVVSTRTQQPMMIYADVIKQTPQEITIELSIGDIEKFRGFQFEMVYDHTKLNLNELVPGNLDGFDQSNYSLDSRGKGRIAMSWDTEGVPVNNRLATLHFNVKSDADAESILTMIEEAINAEAYDADGMARPIQILNVSQKSDQGISAGKLGQNVPNPFTNATSIDVILSEASEGVFTVYDVTGKTVLTKKYQFNKGLNKVIIESTELPSTGIFFYKVESGIFSASRKMIYTK